jgi:hypothetical protein
MVFGIISIILWVATIVGYIINNLLQKNKKLEDIASQQQYQLESISLIVEESDRMLQQVELTQAFKTDDQIGGFFNNLKLIQESLNQFKYKK